MSRPKPKKERAIQRLYAQTRGALDRFFEALPAWQIDVVVDGDEAYIFEPLPAADAARWSALRAELLSAGGICVGADAVRIGIDETIGVIAEAEQLRRARARLGHRPIPIKRV